MVDRKANIDLLRVISAAAIVILHSVTAPLGNASSPIPLLTEQMGYIFTPPFDYKCRSESSEDGFCFLHAICKDSSAGNLYIYTFLCYYIFA